MEPARTELALRARVPGLLGVMRTGAALPAGTHAVVLEPLDLLARLAALAPPPRCS